MDAGVHVLLHRCERPSIKSTAVKVVCLDPLLAANHEHSLILYCLVLLTVN